MRRARPLPADRIARADLQGDIKPDAIISHRLPLEEAVRGYKIFNEKQEACSRSSSRREPRQAANLRWGAGLLYAAGSIERNCGMKGMSVGPMSRPICESSVRSWPR